MGEIIRITNEQLLELHTGIAALDGIVPKPGEFQPFLYDSDVSWNISKNAAIVERHYKVYERERNKLLKAHDIANQRLTNENAAKFSSYTEALELINDKEVQLEGILPLKKADLKLKDNKIPPSVLRKIAPIMADEEKK